MSWTAGGYMEREYARRDLCDRCSRPTHSYLVEPNSHTGNTYVNTSPLSPFSLTSWNSQWTSKNSILIYRRTWSVIESRILYKRARKIRNEPYACWSISWVSILLYASDLFEWYFYSRLTRVRYDPNPTAKSQLPARAADSIELKSTAVCAGNGIGHNRPTETVCLL